jgi:hypothetical protein
VSSFFQNARMPRSISGKSGDDGIDGYGMGLLLAKGCSLHEDDPCW